MKLRRNADFVTLHGKRGEGHCLNIHIRAN